LAIITVNCLKKNNTPNSNANFAKLCPRLHLFIVAAVACCNIDSNDIGMGQYQSA